LIPTLCRDPGVRIPLSPLDGILKQFKKPEIVMILGFLFQTILMVFYVYILQSDVDSSYYKGYSENPSLRLIFHNNGLSKYTSKKMPWKLVCIISFTTKKEALSAEKRYKKYPLKSLVAVINSEKNIVLHYLKGIENR